ncbi:MAG: response regulator [Candidatus Aminicenantes bacterium]|nr:MAG: response regulator [Candidatus Aminicenantes bacterium]
MKKKILVLEDEEELGMSIKKFLEQHNYQVTYFSDITRVESIVVENPDLILTDLLMPHFHGFDICRAVKDDPQLKKIPLIVMTAVYRDAFHKLEAMRIGVEEFIEKPFKFSELLKKVEKFLGPAAPAEEPVIKKVEVRPLTLPEEEDILSPGAETTAPPITPEEEKKRDQVISQQFQEMQQDYASRLPAKIIELEQIWERIQGRQDTKKELALFRRKVHSLTGSGTTFGFKEISEYARQIELQVDMIIVEGEKTITQRKDKIYELLDNMRHHPIVSTELELMRQINKKV